MANTPSNVRPAVWLPLGLILVLYAGLSGYQLNLPGLHYDEAFEAVPALQLLLDQPVNAFRDSGLVLGGRMFPLMTQDYIGAVNTYLAIPFIYLLGPTPAALRTMSILTGAVSLLLSYLFTCRLTASRSAGLVAALLLAVDPTFVFWNRQGVFVTAITAPIGLAAGLAWLAWLQRGSRNGAIAGAFLFGLGLYAKFLFVWLIAAFIGAVVLLTLPGLDRAGLWRARPHRHGASATTKLGLLGRWVILVGAFLLGCWPLVAYNLQTGGTLASISRNALTSYYGVNNLAFGSNLAERLGQLVAMLSGSHFWYLGRVISNPVSPIMFFGVLVGVLLALISTRNRAGLPRPMPESGRFSPGQIVLFPVLVIGLVVLASIGTVSALWVTHYALLMPWPAIAIATGAWFVAPILGPARFGRPLLQAGLGLLVISQFWSVAAYHVALAESGGLSSHSDAIYHLSGWLDTRTGGPVVAMDWGLAAPITYLTGGRVTPVEIFGYAWQSDVKLTAYLKGYIAQPATLYLWRSPDEIIFDRSDEFKALYRPLSLEEDIEAAFYERNGRPILGVTRLVERGQALNPPR